MGNWSLRMAVNSYLSLYRKPSSCKPTGMPHRDHTSQFWSYCFNIAVYIRLSCSSRILPLMSESFLLIFTGAECACSATPVGIFLRESQKRAGLQSPKLERRTRWVATVAEELRGDNILSWVAELSCVPILFVRFVAVWYQIPRFILKKLLPSVI